MAIGLNTTSGSININLIANLMILYVKLKEIEHNGKIMVLNQNK